jgi:isoleucyl-tRNA synthetase
LHETLTVVCRLLAPFAPFMTDAVHRALTGGSVHLASFTRPSAGAHIDAALEKAMEDIRKLATLAHAARQSADVPVRQPLPLLQCVVPGSAALTAELGGLLAAELNVKRVEFVSSTDTLVSLEAKPNFRTLGKKFGKETPIVAEAVSAMPADLLRRLAGGESVTIAAAGASREIDPADLTIVRRASGAAVVQEDAGYGVALDPTVTPALRSEGFAREVISRVQRLRKEARLDVSDRIEAMVSGDAEIEDAVRTHRVRIAEETLAVRLTVGDETAAPFRDSDDGSMWTAMQTVDVDGRSIRLALRKDGM